MGAEKSVMENPPFAGYLRELTDRAGHEIQSVYSKLRRDSRKFCALLETKFGKIMSQISFTLKESIVTRV